MDQQTAVLEFIAGVRECLVTIGRAALALGLFLPLAAWVSTLDGSSMLRWAGILCDYVLNILNFIARSTVVTLTGVLTLIFLVVLGVTAHHLSTGTSHNQASKSSEEDIKQQPLATPNKSNAETSKKKPRK